MTVAAPIRAAIVLALLRLADPKHEQTDPRIASDAIVRMVEAQFDHQPTHAQPADEAA